MIDRLKEAIRDVPGFPKEGIVFKDITPVLADGALFRAVIDQLCEHARAKGAEKIVGIDARGFLFGAAVADRLGLGFIPIRKKGKLPWKCKQQAYALEYGEAVVEMHEDAVATGEKVLLVDDLLATGGTAAAALKLLDEAGAKVVGVSFFIELGFLKGRAKLQPYSIESLITY